MIQIKNLTKYYPSDLGNQIIFENLNFEIPENNNIAILGKNGVGKSTLFRLLAGSEYPNKGEIITDKNLSWPVSLATGIHPQMTGQENVRFIGRVNGVNNLKTYEKKVQEFAELDKRFYLPVKNYSSGMRAKLAFACCICIEFDIYLIDEATTVADQKFKNKSRDALIKKSREANIIMVSHDIPEIKLFCDSAIVLTDRQLKFYSDMDEAIEIYKEL